MSRKKATPSLEHETEVDLIPMMDLALNLTFFFVVLTTLVQDEATRGVTLPLSSVVFKAEQEAKVPDSISLNVTQDGRVMNWGTELSLRVPQDLQSLEGFLGLEASRARSASSDPAKKIVDTSVVLRVDENADCGDFQRLMDACRAQGFRKFILRTRKP